MNTKGKIVVALAVMMVAAAMVVPAVMGDDPSYEVTVISPQSTTTSVSDATFGDVMVGETETITGSLTLTNTGGCDAAVKAKCENQSAHGDPTQYGLIGTSDTFDTPVYIGGDNLRLGTTSNLVALTYDGIDATIDDGTGANKVPKQVGSVPGSVDYDAELTVPGGQTPDSYSGLVTLTFTNA